MMRNRGPDRDQMTAVAVAGELGFGIAGPFVVCTGLGWWLDGQFNTGHLFVLIGLLIGIVSTIGTFYRLATAFPTRPPPKKGPTGSAAPTDKSDQPPSG